MGKLYEIQETVPMCLECGGGLKMNRISQSFQCMHCGIKYKIIGVGKTDRMFICEKIEKDSENAHG